ncbi:deoxyribonuclease IV [candidate division WOR-3 bacterium]|jgi:deoxyribonuclease-4|nr:deoxyribonuclease IV [candidate division WOR-3 bacterium]
MGLLGAHVSTSGGIYNAIENGEKLKCKSIQIFTKNQMRWKARKLEDKDIELFKLDWEKSGIDMILSHDSYLINLGSPDKNKSMKSIKSFKDEIYRCKLLGLNGLIFHPGAHMGKGEGYCISKIAENLNIIIEEMENPNIKLLIETTAGQGTNIGYRFEHLRDIIDSVKCKSSIGICIDTCHIFAAGYDIRTEKGYKKVLDEFDTIVGTDKIEAFHINDCKSEYLSRVDRHENIGAGNIGIKLFEVLCNDSDFANIPMILETPGGEKYYKKNLEILKGLIK